MDDGTKAVHYRARAKQLRAEADTMTTPVAKVALLRIAANYEQLAHRVEISSSWNAP